MKKLKTGSPPPPTTEKPTPRRLTRKDTSRGLGAFETAVGGRRALAEELTLGNPDPAQTRLLILLQDPKNDAVSLMDLCVAAGVKPSEILHFFRESLYARSFVDAHRRMAERLPEVAGDVAEKALNHVEECGACKVRGVVEEGCPACGGTGQVYYRASFQHQTTVLEVMGMLKRGGGVTVNQQQNVGVKLGESFFDGFVKATNAEVIRSEDRGHTAIEGEVSGAERPDSR